MGGGGQLKVRGAKCEVRTAPNRRQAQPRPPPSPLCISPFAPFSGGSIQSGGAALLHLRRRRRPWKRGSLLPLSVRPEHPCRLPPAASLRRNPGAPPTETPPQKAAASYRSPKRLRRGVGAAQSGPAGDRATAISLQWGQDASIFSRRLPCRHPVAEACRTDPKRRPQRSLRASFIKAAGKRGPCPGPLDSLFPVAPLGPGAYHRRQDTRSAS